MDKLNENTYKEIIKRQSKLVSELLKEKYNRESLLEERNQYIQYIEKQNKKKNDYIITLKGRTLYKILRSMKKIGSAKEALKCEPFKVRKIVPDNMPKYTDFKAYDSAYQNNVDFSNNETDIKPLAFYLPQYHTFKENDEWWGKGFTEWVNTKKSQPNFKDHYQPRVPHNDIGYYELTNIDVLKKQIALAKQHGIYGFCFYYYWFSGKRLMEKPVDILLEHPEVDFPFCFCWANENWTRTWDGLEKNVLIAQEYSKEDYHKFIVDIKKYINDPRYIKVDNKPLILIYNPAAIPNLEELINEWKRYAKEEGIGEIYILTKSFPENNDYGNALVADGEFEFAPIAMNGGTEIEGLAEGYYFNYNEVVKKLEKVYKDHLTIKPYYYCCTMGWDNSARRKEGYTLYHNYSLKAFYEWTHMICELTRKQFDKDKRFMFINAWNEWAEGTYLEPDEKYGYANINTFSRAIMDLPFNDEEDQK